MKSDELFGLKGHQITSNHPSVVQYLTYMLCMKSIERIFQEISPPKKLKTNE